MPKMKTRKSVAKRFRLTASGKVKRSRAWGTHHLAKRSSKRKRKLGRAALASPADARRIKRML